MAQRILTQLRASFVQSCRDKRILTHYWNKIHINLSTLQKRDLIQYKIWTKRDTIVQQNHIPLQKKSNRSEQKRSVTTTCTCRLPTSLRRRSAASSDGNALTALAHSVSCVCASTGKTENRKTAADVYGSRTVTVNCRLFATVLADGLEESGDVSEAAGSTNRRIDVLRGSRMVMKMNRNRSGMNSWGDRL